MGIVNGYCSLDLGAWNSARGLVPDTPRRNFFQKGKNIMKWTQTLNFIKFACMVLVIVFSASALASCGDSLSAMAAEAASIHSQSSLTQQGSESSRDNAVNSSIVG